LFWFPTVPCYQPELQDSADAGPFMAFNIIAVVEKTVDRFTPLAVGTARPRANQHGSCEKL
jgi:hypothetical protein